MRGDGLSNVKIGARLGEVSGVYIGAILRKNDPKPVSKKVWDNLIQKEGFKPRDPDVHGHGDATEKVSENTNPRIMEVIERQTTLIVSLMGQANQSTSAWGDTAKRLGRIEKLLAKALRALEKRKGSPVE